MPSVSAPLRVRVRFVWRLVVICCLLAVGVSQLPAQSTFGAILGTVRDSSGALVQGAKITLINVGTTATRAAVTDSDGNYGFNNIDVGTYKLTIGAQGFQTSSLPELLITARETRRADAILKLGAATQTVEVTDSAPVISVSYT